MHTNSTESMQYFVVFAPEKLSKGVKVTITYEEFVHVLNKYWDPLDFDALADIVGAVLSIFIVTFFINSLPVNILEDLNRTYCKPSCETIIGEE